MQPLSTCRSSSSYKISLKSDNRPMSYGQKWFSRCRPPPSWILKLLIFGHVNRIRFNICYSVPNFIKIGRFLTEIWRFDNFQNGGRPPSWILKICSFCHVALVDIPFCYLIQNLAEIGQLVDELWPKSDFQDGGRRHLENHFFGHNSSADCPIPAKIQFLVTWL